MNNKIVPLDPTLKESLLKVCEQWGVQLEQKNNWQDIKEKSLRSLQLCKYSFVKFLKKLKGQDISRGQTVIRAEYNRQWKRKVYDKYYPTPELSGQTWNWGEKRFITSNEAGAALRLCFLDYLIDKYSPTSILEVGCGNGINVLTLSTKFTDCSFTGLELTDSGVEQAQSIISEGILPESLQEFSPFQVEDPRAVSSVSVMQGSALELPWPDNSFDLVYTSLALEQMEELRDQAIQEISRVSKTHIVMLEPFWEANRNIDQQHYIKAYSYFQGAIADLSSYGLSVEEVIMDMPHKALLGTAVVVAMKQ